MSNLQIFDLEQGTEAWFLARAGIPTASCFSKVMAKGRDGGASLTRADYLNQLADEVIYGDPVETYTNANMERGKVMEAEARSIYALDHDVVPTRVGFIYNPALNAGCSPDSLISRKGTLQIKTSFPRLMVPLILRGQFPAEHKPQCQGELWVSEREWCDLMIYWPKRKPLVIRAYRDEAYIAKISSAVAAFNDELAATVAALRTKLDLRGTLEAAQ